MSLGLLLGGAIAVVGMLCNTSKQMHENHLITKKELAEIEAKSKAFEQFVKYHQNTIDRAYDLEKELLSIAKNNLESANMLMDKIVGLDENSKKIELFHTYICQIIEGSTAILLNNPKYFNETLFKNCEVSSIDFHHSTEIGKNCSSSQKDNLLSGQTLKALK